MFRRSAFINSFPCLPLSISPFLPLVINGVGEKGGCLSCPIVFGLRNLNPLSSLTCSWPVTEWQIEQAVGWVIASSRDLSHSNSFVLRSNALHSTIDGIPSGKQCLGLVPSLCKIANLMFEIRSCNRSLLRLSFPCRHPDFSAMMAEENRVKQGLFCLHDTTYRREVGRYRVCVCVCVYKVIRDIDWLRQRRRDGVCDKVRKTDRYWWGRL